MSLGRVRYVESCKLGTGEDCMLFIGDMTSQENNSNHTIGNILVYEIANDTWSTITNSGGIQIEIMT